MGGCAEAAIRVNIYVAQVTEVDASHAQHA